MTVSISSAIAEDIQYLPRLEDMLSRVMLAREGEFLDSDEESGGEAPAGRTAALA